MDRAQVVIALGIALLALAPARAATGQVCATEVAALVAKHESGVPLRRHERLLVALERLGRLEPAPENGEAAYRRLAEVFREVEKEFLPAAVLEGSGFSTIGELVDEAFRVYDYGNGAVGYDENAFPKAFSEVLKPPARRYAWKDAGPDREIILQLDHVTIFNRNGATEIQRIDPAVRSRLDDPALPLVVAIHADPAYFAAMPVRRDLVLFTRNARDGSGVW